ncbi:unnamed protein product, partial [marine sediment metagenome]
TFDASVPESELFDIEIGDDIGPVIIDNLDDCHEVGEDIYNIINITIPKIESNVSVDLGGMADIILDGLLAPIEFLTDLAEDLGVALFELMFTRLIDFAGGKMSGFISNAVEKPRG